MRRKGACHEAVSFPRRRPYAKDKDLETPLHALVASGSVGAVRVLLNRPSLINDPTSIKLALMRCAKNGRLPFHNVKSPEMAQLLLKRPLLGEDEDRVVPKVCHEMSFAKDGAVGKSLYKLQINTTLASASGLYYTRTDSTLL